MNTPFERVVPATAPRRLLLAAALCLAATCRAPHAQATTGTQAGVGRAAASRGADRPAEGFQIPLVTIGARGELRLDGKRTGTTARTEPLTRRLAEIFRRRERARDGASQGTLADGGAQERAVIVMARRSVNYASLRRVLDAVKSAGAATVRLVETDEQLLGARRELDTAPAPAEPAGAGVGNVGPPSEPRDPLHDPAVIKDLSVIISIAPDNRIYVGRRPVALEELEAVTRSLTRELPEAKRVVYIRAHLDATYKLVVDVIDAVKRGGVKQIGLVTDRNERE